MCWQISFWNSKQLMRKLQKNLRGILFAATVCYTNSSLALAGIYTYISLRFTQSNSPTHTKSLFSFRNTRISRISRQSVSASSCKPSTHRKNTFHLGLSCRCSYKFLGQCRKQWMDCLLSASEGDGILFWQIYPKFVWIDQCGFPTFHRGASARTAKVTPAKTC